MANHLAALGGVAAHIGFMEAARSVYRNPVVEALLLGCVLIQVLTGMWLLAGGWKQRRGAVSWLQAAAGAYLGLFLLLHVGAVLFGRVSLDLDTNFYFAAAGFHVPPFQFFFAPYYLLGVLALFTHLGCAAYWRARAAGHSSPALFLAVPAAGGLLLSVMIVLLLAGAFYRVDIPAEYRATYVLGA
jgi:hypothetical protein